METMRACACGERSTCTCSMSGITMSPAYLSRPETLLGASTRRTALPMKSPCFRFSFREHGCRQAPVLHVARHLDRVENLLIARAAADVAAEPLLDLFPVGERVGAQRRSRRHHHARNAIAALAGAGLVEGALQHVQFASLGQRLDGLDLGPLRLGDRQQARLHQHAVDEHRAGAAFARAAAFLVAGEVQVVAQEVEQSLAWLGVAREILRPLMVACR